MQRIDTTDERYHEGDPETSTEGTLLRAAPFNTIQEELAYLVEQAGLSCDPEDDTQIYQGLLRLIGSTREYISGLTLSRGGNQQLDIAVGEARADDNTISIPLTAASFNKDISSTFAAGSGSGCLESGLSIAAEKWYHAWLIFNPSTGAVDVMANLNYAIDGGTGLNPTLPTGFTKKCRIGSIYTDGSSYITDFRQLGRRVEWDAPVTEWSGNGQTTRQTLTVQTPPDVECIGIFQGSIQADSGYLSEESLRLSHPDQSDIVPTKYNSQLHIGVANAVCAISAIIEHMTNSQSQICFRHSGTHATSNNCGISIMGYIEV